MSAGVAWWIAHVSFWMLLVYGWMWDEVGRTGLAVFLFLWIAAYFALPYLAFGGGLFMSFVALLDIVLVFIIFKGDVRLN